MRRVVDRLAGLVVLLLAAIVLSTAARAEPAAAPSPVHVEVALVRATRADAFVDRGLEAFATDLRALPFTHFERLGGQTWATATGGQVEGQLGDVRVQVTVTAMGASTATLHLEVWRGGARLASTTVERPFGRAHVLSAGAEGAATLLVPVRAVR